MNLVEKLNNIFTLETELEQENEISQIGDIFEYSSFEKDEVVEVVNAMLSLVVQDIGSSVRENLLNAVNNALVYQNVGTEVSFDILLPCLSDFSEAHLSYVLTFFGFSGNQKYRPLLEKYLIYDNEEVKEAAQEALCEINFRIKKMNCN